jgi:predicted MFS family arabinose efflux permease
MLRHRNVALCAGISCMLVGSAVLCSIFLPVYFTSVRGWSPERMAGVMALLGLCPPVGGILIPALSDRIGRRPPLVLAGALMVLTPLAALYASGPDAIVVGLMLLGWIGMGSFPLFMAVVPAETLAYRSAAAVMGLVVAIGELTGGVAGPLLAGRLADAFGLQAPLLISAGCAAAGALIATALVETNPVGHRQAVATPAV